MSAGASARAAPRGILPQPGRLPVRKRSVAQARQSAVSGRYQKISNSPPAVNRHQVAAAIPAEADLLDQDPARGLQLTREQDDDEERDRELPSNNVEDQRNHEERVAQHLEQRRHDLEEDRVGKRQ
jgi:hypothetical protein